MQLPFFPHKPSVFSEGAGFLGFLSPLKELTPRLRPADYHLYLSQIEFAERKRQTNQVGSSWRCDEDGGLPSPLVWTDWAANGAKEGRERPAGNQRRMCLCFKSGCCRGPEANLLFRTPLCFQTRRPFSVPFQPLGTLLALWDIRTTWGGYVCDHAWALCCRSPRACCEPTARSGSHVAKYTLRENRRLYIKPNQPWSQELIITPRTRACLHAMASGPTRRPLLRVWWALVLEQSSQSLCWIGVVCWCLLGISCGLVCQYCRLGSTLIGSPSEWNMRNPRHAGLSLRELCGKAAVGLRQRGEERRDALAGKRLVRADVLEWLRGQQVDVRRHKQTRWPFHSSGSFWFSLHLSN